MDNTARDKAHELINRIPENALGSVVDFLEYIEAKERRQNPFANCPIDDEPLTEEDMEAIQEGREAIKRGEVVSFEEIKKELGFDDMEG